MLVSGWDDGKIRAFYPETGRIKFVVPDAHTEKVSEWVTKRLNICMCMREWECVSEWLSEWESECMSMLVYVWVSDWESESDWLISLSPSPHMQNQNYMIYVMDLVIFRHRLVSYWNYFPPPPYLLVQSHSLNHLITHSISLSISLLSSPLLSSFLSFYLSFNPCRSLPLL